MWDWGKINSFDVDTGSSQNKYSQYAFNLENTTTLQLYAQISLTLQKSNGKSYRDKFRPWYTGIHQIKEQVIIITGIVVGTSILRTYI